MNLSLTQFPVEVNARVLSLCRRSGLAPVELAAILAEIPDDAVSQYRSYLLAEVWPNIFTAYLSGGYPACAEPTCAPSARACLSGLLLPCHWRKAVRSWPMLPRPALRTGTKHPCRRPRMRRLCCMRWPTTSAEASRSPADWRGPGPSCAAAASRRASISVSETSIWSSSTLAAGMTVGCAPRRATCTCAGTCRDLGGDFRTPAKGGLAFFHHQQAPAGGGRRGADAAVERADASRQHRQDVHLFGRHPGEHAVQQPAHAPVRQRRSRRALCRAHSWPGARPDGRSGRSPPSGGCPPRRHPAGAAGDRAACSRQTAPGRPGCTAARSSAPASCACEGASTVR